jgi:predicted PurR-regulated permease PerM
MFAWAVVGLFALLALLGLVAWTFRVVFPPLVLGGAIVFILNPVVTFLQKRRIPRVGGTALAYLGVVAILVGLGFAIAPLVQRQADELSQEWPEIRESLEDSVNDLSERSKDNGWIVEIPNVTEIEDQLGAGTSGDAFTEEFDSVTTEAAVELEAQNDDRLAADLDRVVADAKTRFPGETGLSEQLRTVREIGTRVFEVGIIFLIGPIIAFYLLVDLPHIRRVSEDLVPPNAKEEVMVVAHRLNHAVGGFFRGQLAVALIVGIMVSIGLAIIGLPFWLIVGMIAGAFNVIPLIGPWVGAIPGIVIAFTTGGGVGQAIAVAIVMTVAQQIDNHFISPLVMQRAVNLHPAVVMLALLAGGTLGGFFGLLLAVPTAAVLKIILGHLWRTYVLNEPLEQIVSEVEAADSKPSVGFVERVGDEDVDLLPDGTSLEPDPDADSKVPTSG